ncbi:MAG: response regulator [Bacteroidales bacterium]
MYPLFDVVLISCVIVLIVLVVSFFLYVSKKCDFFPFSKKNINAGATLGNDISIVELLNNTSAGIFIRDPQREKRYMYFNKSAQIMCGNNDGAKDDGYKNILKLEQISHETIDSEDAEVLSTGKTLKLERILYDDTGEPIGWLYITKSLIKSIDNRPLILGTIVDITQRHIRKIELENIKKELELALEAGELQAWVYHNDDKSVTTFNKGSVSKKYDMFYEEDKDYLSKDDYDELRYEFNSIIIGEANFHKSVFKIKYPDSSNIKYYEGRMKGVYSQQTGNLNFIIGVKKDITKEIIWQKDLEQNRIKTSMAINAAGIVLWEYDINKKIFSSLDPQSIAYIPVSYDDYFLMVHPKDREIAKEILNNIIAEKGFRSSIEYRILMPTGEYKWATIQGNISDRDENGFPSKIIGIRRDIDNEKKLTKQLIELKEEAEKSNKLKSAYLANMSHEIRTPLNAIVGFSNLMMYMDDPLEKEEYSRIIQINNDLLLQLISDILDLSKIEAGFLVFNYADEDLSTIFKQVEYSFTSRVNPGVYLKVNIPYKKCIINTDKNRLIQVLSNFLTNACKFTTQGLVEFGYTKIDTGIKLYVKDSGIGMTDEQCEIVFDRFSKFGKDVVGTGLGMAICDTIIKSFGGKIGVDSKVGIGSIFWAEIPCNPIIDNTSTFITEQLLINNNDKENREQVISANIKYNVLVAEDNDSNYLLLSKILAKECNLRRANDGAECIELFVAQRPDIIFMDIQMPVMDGYDATLSIREMDKEIPIVAVTANAFDSDKEQALAAGCNDYITKPVSKGILNDMLKKWCN